MSSRRLQRQQSPRLTQGQIYMSVSVPMRLDPGSTARAVVIAPVALSVAGMSTHEKHVAPPTCTITVDGLLLLLLAATGTDPRTQGRLGAGTDATQRALEMEMRAASHDVENAGKASRLWPSFRRWYHLFPRILCI